MSGVDGSRMAGMGPMINEHVFGMVDKYSHSIRAIAEQDTAKEANALYDGMLVTSDGKRIPMAKVQVLTQPDVLACSSKTHKILTALAIVSAVATAVLLGAVFVAHLTIIGAIAAGVVTLALGIAAGLKNRQVTRILNEYGENHISVFQQLLLPLIWDFEKPDPNAKFEAEQFIEKSQHETMVFIDQWRTKRLAASVAQAASDPTDAATAAAPAITKKPELTLQGRRELSQAVLNVARTTDYTFDRDGNAIIVFNKIKNELAKLDSVG